jgi:fucose permease
MNSSEETLSGQPAMLERKEKVSKTVAYYVSFIALGLGLASLGPTLPGLAEHTRTELSQISYLFTANSIGYLLGSLLGGRSYDRLPGHPMMAVALMTMTSMMVLAPLMSLLWALTGVLLGLGFAQGTLDVGGNTLLVWVHRHRVGPFMNGLHFFFGVGAFLSPIIIARAVSISGDITWAYWALALLMVPIAIWLPFLPSPEMKTTSKEGFVSQTNYPLVALVALFFFLHVGAEISYGGWIFTYAVTLKLTNKTIAAYLTSAFWGSLTLGRLVAIPITARFKPWPVLLGDLIGCLASGAVILLWPKSSIAVWVGTVGMGLSVASLFPTSLAFAERRMRITGRVTGWFLVGGSVGGMSLPWLIGQLFESFGPQITILLVMIDLVLALVVLFVLFGWSTRADDGDRGKEPSNT